MPRGRVLLLEKANIKRSGAIAIGMDMPDFMRALADADWRVRVEAAIILGRSGLSGAVEGLKAALGDAYWQVQKEAAHALGKLGADTCPS